MDCLSLVDQVFRIDDAVEPKPTSLASRPLVVVKLDRHSRKGFPFGIVAEVVNDYAEVIENKASAINLSLVDSRLILELKHVSHNFLNLTGKLVASQALYSHSWHWNQSVSVHSLASSRLMRSSSLQQQQDTSTSLKTILPLSIG